MAYSDRIHGLSKTARLFLFITSYSPLFLLMAIKQLIDKQNYLNYGGFNLPAFTLFCKHFLLSSCFILITALSFVTLKITLKNFHKRVKNSGETFKVIDIENKTHESITYLFTYLIPLAFQDLSKLNDVISILVFLFITCIIYINSSLILVNPILNIFYSLYSIEFTPINQEKKYKAMIISKQRLLLEGDYIKVKKMHHKLYYSEILENTKDDITA